MKLKNIGYAAFIAATAAALRDRLGRSRAMPKPRRRWRRRRRRRAPALTAEQPVCATKGGMKFTYANACFAAKDGAKVVSQSACPAKKAMKHHKKSRQEESGQAGEEDEKKKM